VRGASTAHAASRTVDTVIVFETVSPHSSVAEKIIRAYLFEVASRYHGRPVTPEELDQAVLDEPWNELENPTGLFLVAMDDGVPVACGGLRFVRDDEKTSSDAESGGGAAEITKLFTREERRGEGIGSRLMLRLENTARQAGATVLRLDTRTDLAEARRLYERLGFIEVPAFNTEPHSNRWYAKDIGASAAQ
jgi:ribosomal protein S18 acetylase RimI-like enzyme